MVLSRRRTLRAAGATALTALAGCTSSTFGSDESQEYSFHVEPIRISPVEHARYEPGDNTLFGDPARAALGDILPEGRHTTYGYEALPGDSYVEYDGTYYQTKNVVTGREEMERTLVQVDSVPDEDVPEDAILVDALEQPSARVVKILHSSATTDSESSSAELLRGDAYVLRRPAERESQFAAGELDDRVVTMTEDGSWAYRIRVTTERITETAHTAVAVEVADSRDRFREVVFGSRIDAELAPDDLPADARDILDQAIERDAYRETTPLSEAFDALLKMLGLGGVDTAANGKLLWYDGEFYRYAVYVNDAS